MPEHRVYLVDASIYVCRAWFALPLCITDREGNPANAIYGFMDFVSRLLGERGPTRIAFVFDESLRTSFRNQIYPAYKANRPPAPPELRGQFLLCREFVHALGCLELSSDRYEADDLIGALTVHARALGYPSTIVSGDKDLTQLLRDGDLWWDFARAAMLNGADVEKRFGVRPNQIADLLAIAGDKVDNVPGVPGVGLATAAKLLRRFHTLENMLDNTPRIAAMKMRGALRLQRLIEIHADTPRLAQRLTRIDCEAQLPQPLRLARGRADTAQLDAIFDKLGGRARCPGLHRWRLVGTDLRGAPRRHHQCSRDPDYTNGA
jgi:DNA polymerase-1